MEKWATNSVLVKFRGFGTEKENSVPVSGSVSVTISVLSLSYARRTQKYGNRSSHLRVFHWPFGAWMTHFSEVMRLEGRDVEVPPDDMFAQLKYVVL